MLLTVLHNISFIAYLYFSEHKAWVRVEVFFLHFAPLVSWAVVLYSLARHVHGSLFPPALVVGETISLLQEVDKQLIVASYLTLSHHQTSPN